MMTRACFIELMCPCTEEIILADMSAAGLVTRDNMRTLSPQTRVWWAHVSGHYLNGRRLDPKSDPRDTLDLALRAWPEEAAAA